MRGRKPADNLTGDPVRSFPGPQVAALALLLSGAAWANRPAGAEALEQARDAWGRGEFPQAEAHYQESLAHGGLSRDQALECWVHVGAARAVLGKKELAMAAFRQAALMDARFVVPPEAGKRATVLAETVRSQQAAFGELHLKVSVPSSPPPSVPIPVVVSMDPAHVGLITRLWLVAKGLPMAKAIEQDGVPAETVRFTLPASLASAGADLSVRVDALDGSDNQLATFEARVRVLGATSPADVPSDASPGRGGFWSSPWPYVIGGALLTGVALGSVGLYFGAQTPAQVNVGPPSIRSGS